MKTDSHFSNSISQTYQNYMVPLIFEPYAADIAKWVLRQCDALYLSFADQKFDKGRYYFNVWDKISDNPFTDEIEQALEKFFPNDPPKFMSRTPHGYFDEKLIHRELTAAGFSEIEIETVTHTSKAPSANFIAEAFCTGTILRSEIESRAADSLEKATAFVSDALTKRFGGGELEGKIQALVMAATKL